MNKQKLSQSLLFLLTVLYAVCAIFLHMEVSRIVVGSRSGVTGSFIPREYSVEGGIIFIIFLLIILAIKYYKGVNRLYHILYIYLFLLYIYLYFRVYSLHPVEVIHIVHYSILTLLLGYTFDKARNNFLFKRLLLIGFCIGFLDEVTQYFVLIPDQTYLDFNDIYVNMLGSISGLLLFYSFKPVPLIDNSNKKSVLDKKTFFVISIVIVFVIAMFVNGNLHFTTDHVIPLGAIENVKGESVIYIERLPNKFGNYLRHLVKGYFYNLSPSEWLLLTFITLTSFFTYDPRYFSRIKYLRWIHSIANVKIKAFENDKK